MLASDAMGLGMAAPLARRMANGGAGTASSLQIASAGTTNLNATQIGGQQYVVSVTSGTAGVALPAVGGENGCLLADDFIVNNASSGSITLFLPTGVSISTGGSNQLGSVGITLAQHKTIACFPVSATQWIGVLGN